jgi:hypothetical protein
VTAAKPRCPLCGSTLSYEGVTTVSCYGPDNCPNLDPAAVKARKGLADLAKRLETDDSGLHGWPRMWP